MLKFIKLNLEIFHCKNIRNNKIITSDSHGSISPLCSGNPIGASMSTSENGGSKYNSRRFAKKLKLDTSESLIGVPRTSKTL